MRLLALVILAGLLGATSATALAHGGGHGSSHLSLGFTFGVPLGYYYYPPPYYYYPPAYYPPAAVLQPPPAVYVERSDVVPETAGTWFFCKDSNSYYPYVKQCPGGWQRVPAQPPPQ